MQSLYPGPVVEHEDGVHTMTITLVHRQQLVIRVGQLEPVATSSLQLLDLPSATGTASSSGYLNRGGPASSGPDSLVLVSSTGAVVVPGTLYSLVAGSTLTLTCWGTPPAVGGYSLASSQQQQQQQQQLQSLTLKVEGSLVLMRNIYLVRHTAATAAAAAPKSHLSSSSSSSSSPPLLLEGVLEYHALLHRARVRCLESAASANTSMTSSSAPPPPWVLVLGRSDSAKRDVAASLVNFAARATWPVVLCDLDPEVDQMVSVPGSIGMTMIETPLSVQESFSDAGVQLHYFIGNAAAQSFHASYHVGAAMKSLSVPLQHYTDVLLAVLKRRQAALPPTLSADSHTSSSSDAASSSSLLQRCSAAAGAVIVAPELRGGEGIQWILSLLEKHPITHVLSVGSNTLFFEQLRAALKEKEPSQVRNLHKSSSATHRAEEIAVAEGLGEGRVFHLPVLSSTFSSSSSFSASTTRAVCVDQLSGGDFSHVSSSGGVFTARTPKQVVAQINQRFNSYFFHNEHHRTRQPYEYTKSLNAFSAFRVTVRDGRTAAIAVERGHLDTLDGSVVAIVDPLENGGGMRPVPGVPGGLLGCSVIAFGRIMHVDAQEVKVFTTLPMDPATGKLTVLVGDLRWLIR